MAQKMHQSSHLNQFDAAKLHFDEHHTLYCSKVCDCMKSRLAWTGLDMLCDIILVLDGRRLLIRTLGLAKHFTKS